ncbi:hypothetical protein FACS189447_06420 [Spirochaetia bacterium]|nr:hypothetical protein FACS189447_06420 [Spirochaetia bacterium]
MENKTIVSPYSGKMYTGTQKQVNLFLKEIALMGADKDAYIVSGKYIFTPYQLQCALESTLDPDEVDSEGNTLIMQFIKQDKPLDLLKVIMKSNCALDVVNKDGLNALDIAVNQGHKDAVRLLVDQGLQHTKKWEKMKRF